MILDDLLQTYRDAKLRWQSADEQAAALESQLAAVLKSGVAAAGEAKLLWQLIVCRHGMRQVPGDLSDGISQGALGWADQPANNWTEEAKRRARGDR